MRLLVVLLGVLLVGCLERPAGGGATRATEPAPSPSTVAPGRVVTGPRLVILGFDGIDPARVDRLAREGRLPNLARLGARGYRGPLRSTNPPQSPVAWAAFATGLPAGTHGIFDFVARNAETYLPDIATTRVTHAQVDGDHVTPAKLENLRRGDAFWDVIARAGVPARALRVPYAYPPPPDGAVALAGLGLPDVRGSTSSFTLLTTDATRAAAPPPAGGMVALLDGPKAGPWQAMVAGPVVLVDRARRATFAPVTVRREGERLRLELGGRSVALARGETGPWVQLELTPAPALTVRAATRFTVRSVTPPELYVEPLSVVPDAPYLAVSSPPPLAVGLWRKYGPFKTVGWVDDTSALGAGAMDEDQFLREAFATMRLDASLLVAALEQHSERLVVSVSVSPDRIAHMFYRYLDPEYPQPGADPAYSRALDDAYVEMDHTVGAASAALSSDDVLLVMSDHGFTSFRRGFNLNTWLLRQGYLVLERGAAAPADFFSGVDWSRTRAYALGTGSVYLNLRGREAKGIVDPAEAPALARSIARRLLEVTDGRAGRVVLAAYLGDELYAGPARAAAPDVRVALAPGYRASWATALGGAPAALFEDNGKKWSGDHASSRPEDVPGLLVSSHPLSVPDPGLEDLAPTAYRFAGVTPPPGVAGRPLLRR